MLQTFRASGIATLTRECKDMISMLGSRVRVAATRKTTPGFRLVEKYAVVVGGGSVFCFLLQFFVNLGKFSRGCITKAE